MTDNTTIRDTRDMALTHKDFYRILPRAVGENEYTVLSNGVDVTVGSGKVNITLGDQQLRKIALMEVPWCRVDFTATGLSESEIEKFAEFFHRRFQRGGG